MAQQLKPEFFIVLTDEQETLLKNAFDVDSISNVLNQSVVSIAANGDHVCFPKTELMFDQLAAYYHRRDLIETKGFSVAKAKLVSRGYQYALILQPCGPARLAGYVR